jgi:sortase A
MSGHRTTFGAPFFRLNELQVGDPIDVVSGPVRYRYRVRAHTDGASHEIVPPSAVDVVANHGRAELTLTTCHPRFSAAQRLVVHADYEGASRLDAAPPPTADGGTAPAPEPELVPDSKPLIPTDVAVLLGIAVAALLAAMALSQRLRNTAIWSGVVLVGAAGLGVAVFPQILRLMPANY